MIEFKGKEYKEVWFTSDLHYGHANILKYCKETRPFKDVEEMNQKLIQLHNDTVGPDDLTFILGDFAFMKADATRQVLDQLNGDIFLILGNHDVSNNRNGAFNIKKVVGCQDYFSGSVDGHKMVMFHFPIWEWDRMHRGSIHLHGHLHGKPTNIGGKILDVGFDAYGQYLKLEDVVRICDKKEVREHHE